MLYVFLAYLLTDSTLTIPTPVILLDKNQLRTVLPVPPMLDCAQSYTLVLRIITIESERTLATSLHSLRASIDNMIVTRVVSFVRTSHATWWCMQIMRIPLLVMGFRMETVWYDILLHTSFRCPATVTPCGVVDPRSVINDCMGTLEVNNTDGTWCPIHEIQLIYLSNFSDGTAYYMHYYRHMYLGLIWSSLTCPIVVWVLYITVDLASNAYDRLG